MLPKNQKCTYAMKRFRALKKTLLMRVLKIKKKLFGRSTGHLYLLLGMNSNYSLASY